MNRSCKKMEYSEHELRKHISYFVMERSKTAHLDFKQEWHEKMEDLIKDIICFANTVHDKDCFLVFGISDSYQIVWSYLRFDNYLIFRIPYMIRTVFWYSEYQIVIKS